MNVQEMQSIAPAMFSEVHAPGLSSKYAHYNTAHVVEKLGQEGFYPIRVMQSRSRKYPQYAKHAVVLRKHDIQQLHSGITPEILIRTDHAGSSSWRVDLGVFRFICENGMVIGDFFETLRVRHTGKTVSEVIAACVSAAKRFVGVQETIEQMMGRKLSEAERMAMAEFGLKLRFPVAPPIGASDLLLTHRQEDQRLDLWTTLNVIQENVIRGGAIVKNRRVRGIFEIDRNTDINKALWDNAEQMLVN